MDYIINTTGDVTAWLERYGHKSVADLQRWLGAPETNAVDADLLRLMEQPRCGVADEPAVASRRWVKRNLRYYSGKGGFSLFHGNLPRGESQRDTQLLVEEALARWRAILPCLTFTRTMSSDVDDCDILFGGGRGAVDGFDETALTLCWAHMPGGPFRQLEARFNMGVNYGRQPGDAEFHARPLMMHLVGHLIGLPHSNDPADLMYPVYNPRITEPQPGDIASAVALYDDEERHAG